MRSAAEDVNASLHRLPVRVPNSWHALSVPQLGSVLEPEATGPRGEDLVATVEVPRQALGHPEGIWVEVPRKLPHAGELVERVVDEEEGERVLLRLPEGFPENGALKLRGQGAPHDAGTPGDLIVRVHLTDEPFEGGPANGGYALWYVLVLAALAASVGAFLYWS